MLRHPIVQPFINTFIGRNSHELIQQANEFRAFVTRELRGLPQSDPAPGNPLQPSSDNLYMYIAHQRTTTGFPQSGKIWPCKHFHAFIIIDDSAQVCRDALINGVLPYQITPVHFRRPVIFQVPEPLRSGFGRRHERAQNLFTAWQQILSDFDTGRLREKIDWVRNVGPPLGYKFEIPDNGYQPFTND